MRSQTLIRRAATYLRPYWKQEALVLVGTLVAAGYAIVEPLAFQWIIDRAIIPRDFRLLGLLLSGLGFLFVAQSVASLGREYLNAKVAANVLSDMRLQLFRHLQRLSMGYGEDTAILNFTVHAREALKYFEDKAGLRMNVIRDCPDYYYGLTNDSVSEGRLLEVEPFPGPSLGEWQEKTRLSPQVPYGLTTQDIADAGGLAAMIKWDFELLGRRITEDERCAGSGLAAYFVKVGENTEMWGASLRCL